MTAAQKLSKWRAAEGLSYAALAARLTDAGHRVTAMRLQQVETGAGLPSHGLAKALEAATHGAVRVRHWHPAVLSAWAS